MKVQEEGGAMAGSDGGGAKGHHTYEDPYDESSGGAQFTSASRDQRPREDYDEPWEWSAKQSAMFQARMDSTQDATGQQSAPANKTPLMTPKRTKTTSEEQESASNGLPSPAPVPNGPTAEQPNGGGEGAEQQHPGGQQKRDTRVGNYEEPWDLSSTQKDLEDKIKAASIGGGPPSEQQTNGEKAAKDGGGASAAPHISDKRPLEGYEKPWDWKPHRKDDRGPEGYEKPWDWKPHQKDDRPTEEYEEPWDNKAIEELGLPPAGGMAEDAQASPGGGASGEATPPPSTSRVDDRPAEEYEEPWDQKKNKTFLARTGTSPRYPSHPLDVKCLHVDVSLML